MKLKKLAAITLSSAMAMGAISGITGCNKNGDGKKTTGIGSNGSNSTIVMANEEVEYEEESPWFNYKEIVFQPFESDEYFDVYLSNDFIKTDNGYITTASAFSEDDGYVVMILEMDFDGNPLTRGILDKKKFGIDDNSSADIMIQNLMLANDNIYAFVVVYGQDKASGDYYDKKFIYNATTDEVVDLSYLDKGVGEYAFAQSAGVTDDGYEFAIYSEYLDDITYTINFGKEGKVVKSICANDSISGLIDEMNYMDSDGGVARFACAMESSAPKILGVNTADMSVSVEDFDYEKDGYYEVKDDDNNTYYSDFDGIYRNDDLYFDYNWSFCNPTRIRNSTLIDASNDSFTCLSMVYTTGGTEARLYVFEKADKNPNIGKTLLTIGYINEIDPGTSEAISKFNEKSDDYFLVIKSYDSASLEENYDQLLEMEYDEWRDYMTKQSGDISNKLAIDFLNGEGPDLLINTMNFTQFNNDDFMIDLASFVDNEVGEVEFFDNVMNASKTNGKLYQVPLSFAIEGILTDKKNVKNDTGFSFEEYQEFVDKVCNGKNPIAEFNTRSEVFSMLLKYMSDEFFDEEGNVDFTNDTFYKLAEYCKDSIPKDIAYEEGTGGAVGYSNPAPGGYYNSLSILSDLFYYKDKFDDIGLYGLPSLDNRGPSILVDTSIGICASCSNIDAGKEFIKFILSDEDMLNSTWSNSISVKSTEKSSRNILSVNNKEYKSQLKDNTEAQLREWNYFEFDDSIVDEYIGMLKKASTISALDPSIICIINEEIEPYFAGQKVIEDVASIIEDRAQTVIDEKG